MGACDDWDLKLGSHSCDPSALPLSYPTNPNNEKFISMAVVGCWSSHGQNSLSRTQWGMIDTISNIWRDVSNNQVSKSYRTLCSLWTGSLWDFWVDKLRKTMLNWNADVARCTIHSVTKRRLGMFEKGKRCSFTNVRKWLLESQLVTGTM